MYDAAGGIVGYARSAHLTVDRCYSTGIITAGRCMAKNSLTYAAGICGYSIGVTYTNCYHAGQLATANTSTSYKSTLSGIRCNSGSVNSCYYNSDSVSYTHLDVYKRQIIICGVVNSASRKNRSHLKQLRQDAGLIPGQAFGSTCAGADDKIRHERNTTDHGTTRDVYKRQV